MAPALMDKWRSAYLSPKEYKIKMAMNAFCGKTAGEKYCRLAHFVTARLRQMCNAVGNRIFLCWRRTFVYSQHNCQVISVKQKSSN